MTKLIVILAIFFVVGGVLFALSSQKYPVNTRRRLKIKFWIYLLIVSAFVGVGLIGSVGYGALVTLIAFGGAKEVYSALEACCEPRDKIQIAVWSIYLPVVICAVFAAFTVAPELILFMYLTVAAFDAASQISGQFRSRIKLSPTISPNKSAEGFLGGLLLSGVVAAFLSFLVLANSLAVLPYVFLVGTVALSGDLAASWLKRKAGLKDFGAVIPGHGGVLDRFDSFLPNCAILAFPFLERITGAA